MVSAIAGVVEASLLALIASIAMVMASGQTSTAVALGPLHLQLDLQVGFWVAAGLVLVRTVLQLLVAYIPAATSASAIADLRSSVFNAYLAASWTQKSREKDGVLQALMSTHVNGTSQALLYIGSGLSALFMFLTMLVSALLLSPVAAIAIIVASLLLFAGLRPLSGELRKSARRLSNESKAYATEVQQVSALAEETQVFGATPSYRARFHRVIEAVRAPALRSRFLSQSVPAIYQSVALLMLVLALVVVSMSAQSNIASLGAIVLVLVRAQSFAQQVQSAISSLDEKAPFMNELADSINAYLASAEDPGTVQLPSVDKLELREVKFSYNGRVDVLKGVSLELKRGESLGVVGPSGAGKSSLVQVLLRLRVPTAGHYLANDVDASDIQRDNWRNKVAYVPQFPQLINGTAAENIRFFRPELTDAELVEAAKRAHIHDEIMSWPKQYDTVIGQKVSAVSGGQRQRLCLARALADNPDVLILDEPTSALDLISERAVQDSLEELRADRILILIAHRISTLAICDRVLCLVDGRVDAIGPQAEVEVQSEFFRSIATISRASTEFDDPAA